MKKFLLSASVLGVFAVYALHTKLSGSVNTPISSLVSNGLASATYSGTYKDGTYTGSVADAFYGNIQVQVTISGGKISNIVFLQYPSDRQTSIQINSQAMPILKQETIQAQSAKVDGVSGATQTSGAFIQSLTSALQQAS
jgi:uncharacterized protein with FMN-binding domain